MKPVELTPLSTIDSEPRQTEVDTNRDVSTDIENFRVSVIESLSVRIYNLMDVLAVMNEDVTDKTLSLADGTHLVVCHKRGAEFNALSFYLSSSDQNDAQRWSTHALTCEHVVVYSWHANPDTGEMAMQLDNWSIDPGDDPSQKMVESIRYKKTYEMAFADLKGLTDIAEQFNKVANHF